MSDALAEERAAAQEGVDCRSDIVRVSVKSA